MLSGVFSVLVQFVQFSLMSSGSWGTENSEDRPSSLFPHDFYQDLFVPLAIELGIKNCCQGPKSSLPFVTGTITS